MKRTVLTTLSGFLLNCFWCIAIDIVLNHDIMMIIINVIMKK